MSDYLKSYKSAKSGRKQPNTLMRLVSYDKHMLADTEDMMNDPNDLYDEVAQELRNGACGSLSGMSFVRHGGAL